MLKLVMDLLNWVVGVLEVVAPVLVAQTKVAEVSIAIVLGILLVLLLFYRHKILPNSVVWIRKICHRTLVASAKATTLSMEAIKVNDSVYQLHKPDGDPKLQVIFFHGLLFGDSSEMHLSTWQSDDGSGCIWPKTWLAKEFPDAQILVVSYVDGLEEGSAERFDMHNISENLINDFMQAGIGQMPYCPVVLVGHSFGGLVIKELCLQAHNMSIGDNGGSNIKKFLDNLRGIFYYSTPHRGSPHIDKAEKHLKGPLFKYFRSLSTDAAVLNYRFNNLPRAFHQNLHVEGLGEGRKVQSGLFKGCVVVPEASARDGDKFNIESTADHFSICRPKDKTSRRFKYLTTLLQNIDEKMKEEKKTRDEILERDKAMAVKHAIRQDLQEDVRNRKLVGVEIRLKEVNARLGKCKTLGLTGMGGVGKSTLAKLVFNQECHANEYTCFINDLKSKGEQCDLEDLVWKHMHHHGRKVGNEDVWSDLTGKRLLLVLDDILGDRDITFLSNKANLCSPESRFIVTTRDSDKISKSVEDMDIDIYEIPFLDQDNSNELFMIKAFAEEKPIPEVISVMEEIVRKCDGLPLTLAVIGSYLRKGKKENIDAYVQRWRQTLNALDQAEQVTPIDEKLWAKLRLSYDSLARKEKEVFLDATTFFSDTFERSWRTQRLTLREAKAAWRKAYSTNYECCNELLAWQTLVDRGLVYDVGEDDQIKIHEQLLSLGRKISSESNDKIRVWDQITCQVSKLLQNTELQNKEFHALKLADDSTIPDHALPRLKKLRYLEANFSSHRVGKSLPSELVLVKCCNFQQLQDFLPVELRGHLAVLRLSEVGCIPSCIGQFSSLRIFTSQGGSASRIKSQQIIPDEIGDLTQLEYLALTGVDSIYSQSLPETFGNLYNLRDLRIYDFYHLHSLPKSFGHLASLKHLELIKSQRIAALPDSFGNLPALEHLKLEYCGFVDLPDSFGDLPTLRYLELRSCRTLYKLCDSFGNLSGLKYLQIQGCDALNALPDSFGNLSGLEHLELNACRFEALPDSFGDLFSLEHFDLENCQSLHGLPDSFGNLSKLKHLRIYSCNLLNALPDSFGNLSALEHLELKFSPLKALPDSFGDLFSLEHFELARCHSLYRLSDSFGNLSRLKHLQIDGCNALNTLPDSFGNLSGLEHLKLHGRQFEALPKSFGHLVKLTHLELIDCGNWVSLLPFGQFTELQYLEIRGFDEVIDLEKLPVAIGELKALHQLIISKISMRSIPNWIKNVQSLQTLELGQLPFLQDLPSWLGEKYGLPLALSIALSRKVFHVQDGQFTLVTEGIQDMRYAEWIHSLRVKAVEMVEISDYERALQYLSPYNLGELQPKYQRFLLQERGIVKRFKGDLHGALEDLTRAEGALSEADDGQDSLYEIRKHRGYVNFLLGNLDDAEKDGAMALSLVPEFKFDNLLPTPFFKEQTTTSTLGEKSVTYMHFRLGKRQGFKLDDLSELMDSTHSQVMEKVKESKFKDALACWNVIDTGASSSPHELFFLQERGVLLRLAGDLHGALMCLTAALKIYGNSHNVDGDKSEVDYYGYNCWKHRGYVNFLLRDLDRAQYDGGMALKVQHCQLGEQQLMWKILGFPSHELEMPSSLGEELVKYMQFRLVGRTDPGHIGRFSSRLYSSGKEMEEKLRVSDFSGALAIWDGVGVDGKVACLSEWFFFLLQRGTLKRLAGDLHGAIGDLTTAWEIIGDSEDLTTTYKSLNLPDSLWYECLKQRGFVNYLLGNLDGAHKYGTMALKDPEYNPVYSEAEDGDRYTYDCWKHRGYVKFLREAQLGEAKRDGAMAPTPDWNQATNVAGMVSPSVGEESVTYHRATYGATFQETESIGARELSITWGGDDRYWHWCGRHGSRYAEVAFLERVCWLEVNGRWQGYLSPGAYTLFWRLCLPEGDVEDLSDKMGPIEFSFEASGNARLTTECYLTPFGARTSRELSEGKEQPLGYRWEPDAWMELDVGKFTVESDDLPVEITFSMKEVETGEWKENLYLDGVVICPSWTTHNRMSLSTLQDSEVDIDSLDDSQIDSDSLDDR